VKIALAHYSSTSDISGVTTWFEKLVIRMQKDGLNPLVHLHHFGDNPEKSTLLPVLRDSGVFVHVVTRKNTVKEDILQTFSFLQQQQPTVFLPQCLNAHFYAAAIAGRRGLPWALTMHSDDPDYWDIAKARPPQKYGGKMVCVSNYLSRQIIEQGYDLNPHTIPCGVDIPAKTTFFNEAPFSVVYSGRLIETQKRLSLVTEALIQSCLQNPRVYGTIIGDGPSMSDCKVMVALSGLSDRIFFTGRLSPQDTRQKLLTAQAILLMSDFEGLPVAILEAMAAGVVPVVRSIHSGIPELVIHEQTGLLVDDNPHYAATAILRLVNDEILWHRCSNNARELIKYRYNEESSYLKWVDVIEILHKKTYIKYPLKTPISLRLACNESYLSKGYPKKIKFFKYHL
jgi:colanic acid/amylovoran biosynthesis glycosyltransferase